MKEKTKEELKDKIREKEKEAEDKVKKVGNKVVGAVTKIADNIKNFFNSKKESLSRYFFANVIHSKTFFA